MLCEPVISIYLNCYDSVLSSKNILRTYQLVWTSYIQPIRESMYVRMRHNAIYRKSKKNANINIYRCWNMNILHVRNSMYATYFKILNDMHM